MNWIYDYSYGELKSATKDMAFQPFVTDQIFLWLYLKNIQRIDLWSNISVKNRETIKTHLDTNLLPVKQLEKDEHGTHKFLFSLKDGHAVEAVLIPEKHHYTFCISTQVGCPLNCSFCATGTMGFKRNLTSGEILSQILSIKKEIPDYTGKLNIVFMGMGEPLLNYENLKKALEVMTSPKALSISPRNITISTAGILEKIKQLESDFPKIKISFSLNAPDETVREKLMPISKKEPLEAILGYFRQNSRKYRVTFEYVMIKGITDSMEDAKKIAIMLRGIECKINLIPYNENAAFDHHTPDEGRVDEFGEFLSQKGYTVMVRWSKGKSIKSACGQLATGT